MNNIFKVIWNHATQTWTAVGELASAKGKSKSIKLAAISTALLVAASGVEAANVVSTAGELGQLSIATDKVTNQFFGNARYKAETKLSKNVAGATVNAYDGIAIGNGAVSGAPGAGGNAHVAIGLMAHASAGGANGQNAAVALGAYSLATGQGGTAIGAHSIADALNSTALGKVAKANGDGSTALGTSSQADRQAVALGNTAAADAPFSTSIGTNSRAVSNATISIGNEANATGFSAVSIGRATKVNGESSVAVGRGSTVSSKNVSVLGSDITVGTGRDGAVVLGHGSDAGKDTDVIAVHSAKIGEQSKLTYTGFAGDLGGTNDKGKNKPAAKDKQGNFVSIGSEDNERQIKHVAAGRITADSTDALNGSQLYSVAKTLGNAAEGLADTLGVDLNEDGTIKTPFEHTLNTSTSNYTGDKVATNVTTALTQLNDYVNAGWTVGNNTAQDVRKILPNGKVNFVDGKGTTSTVTENGTNGANVTFNVKKDVTANTTTGLEANGSNNVLNVGENGVSVVSGTITKATKNTKGEVKADGAKDNQVATVKNVVEAINSAGFVVSNGKSDKSELINAGKTLTLQGGDGVNVEQNGSNFTFSIDSSKLLEGKTGGITVNQDKKAGETDAGKATVNDNDATKLATVKNVADAINGAKWFAKVENLSDSMNVQTQKDQNADAQAMGAGDILTLKADKNLAVKRVGANVTYGLASEIEVDKITVKAKTGETVKGTTVENGKVTNLDNHLTAPTKVTGGNVVNATEVKAPTLTDAQKKEAATVNDVLNAGWNLKTNGNQAIAITNGKGLDFASDDNSVTITPTVDKDGNAKVNISINATSVINNTKGTISEATTEDPKADKAGQVTVTGTPQPKADGSMETQEEANAREGNKLATVENVVKAINSTATFIKVADSQEVITASTADDNGVAVKSGDTVTHTAGKNLKVKRDGKSVTYALAQDIDVNSVKATNGVTIGSGDNATTITSNDKGLNLAGKDGAETNINNVKDADLNSTSKQAVNGSQLYTTNVQVNKNSQNINRIESKVDSLSRVINNHADELNRLDRKVNKQGKEARAGIAGANAAAALPQVYTPGKSMVAASAGTFKGQNAVAVGYSRASDNGKVILKLQGNANTSGDVGAGVGVGYQW